MREPLPYRTGERLLTLENVGVHYAQPVLRAIDASIDNIIRDGMQQGQVVCLLGPSGIGKTQLFRCIAGLQRPACGSVLLNGVRKPVAAGDVGVVAQHYPLLAHRTVFGNLLLAAHSKHHGKAEARQAVLNMLEEFSLQDYALHYPAQLSGGQRQRVAIAQQLLCSSHFLLMDEPFSGLDPAAKEAVCATILKVSTLDELNTIIVVTHDIEAALKIADTLWVLGREPDAQGQIIPGAKIMHRYDLIARGIAWQQGAEQSAEFAALAKELKSIFHQL